MACRNGGHRGSWVRLTTHFHMLVEQVLNCVFGSGGDVDNLADAIVDYDDRFLPQR